MPSGTALLAVGSVVLGWMLNEVSAHFRGQQIHRSAIGRAVADLMEVAHELKVADLLVVELSRRYSATPTEIKQALPFIEGFLPPDGNLPERYNRAVSEIAAVDPGLAFRLRRREAVPHLIRRIRALELSSAAEGAPLPDFEAYFRKAHGKDLDDLILEVSRLHGWRTYRRVRRILNKRVTLSEEFGKALEEMRAPGRRGDADVSGGVR